MSTSPAKVLVATVLTEWLVDFLQAYGPFNPNAPFSIAIFQVNGTNDSNPESPASQGFLQAISYVLSPICEATKSNGLLWELSCTFAWVDRAMTAMYGMPQCMLLKPSFTIVEDAFTIHTQI